MGHWEQTSKENRKYKEKQDAMHPLYKKILGALGSIFLIVISIAAWAMMFSPLLSMFMK